MGVGRGFSQWLLRGVIFVAALGAVACGGRPVTPANGPSVQEICGRAPGPRAGMLRQTTREDIGLYVSTQGSEASARHVREAFAKERLACGALSYLACEAAVEQGASQGQALEVHRLASASNACQKPNRPPTARRHTTPPKKRSWRPGKFMVQALNRVVKSAQRAQKTTRYRFDSTGSTVLGAFLMKGKSIDLTRPLDGGVPYAFIGGGSDTVRDLDVALFDMKGQRVAADTGHDASPFVAFTPPRSGRYKIVLTLSDTKVRGSFAALSVMRARGGYKVPLSHFARSFRNALTMASVASNRVHKKSPSSMLVFHSGGDWCFYATVLEQGESLAFRGIDVKRHNAVFMAATDGVAKDVDLTVTDARSNRIVAKDTGNDNTPMTFAKPSDSASYSVKLAAERSPKPSMVTLLVLDLVKGRKRRRRRKPPTTTVMGPASPDTLSARTTRR